MQNHVVVPKNIRACVFDFDGVVVDSEPLHMHAILRAVAPRGWTYSVEQFVEHIVGRGDERAFHSIAEWHGVKISERELADFLADKQRRMAIGIDERQFGVQPGAIETIRAAAERFGKRIAVCSGSRASAVVPMLRAIGVAGLFDVAEGASSAQRVVTHDDVRKTKPDPEGYLLAVERLGVRPEETMAIEDTASGVAAAKSAGLFTIAVTHTLPSEKLAHADVVVPRISDVRWAETLSVQGVAAR